MRHTFRVSVKAAVFNHDKTKIAVIQINDDRFGLPGGHMEQNETIEQAISRELFEECGITKSNLQKSDFFMNKTDRIILAFVGTTDQIDLLSQQNELEGVPLWVDKNQFTRLNINPKYKDFVLKNWS